MDEQGLASVSMQQAPTPGGGNMELTEEDYNMIMEEVIRLLQEGVPPEELIAMGVPEEMIQEALAMLGGGGSAAPVQPQGAPVQPQVAPAQAAPVTDGGLAMSGM